MTMTSDALVRAILTAETCELYDRERIRNLFKNIVQGYGKLTRTSKTISITYSGGKSKKMEYIILKEILTPEQLTVVSSFFPE